VGVGARTHALVEVYLDYDCDSGASVYEHLMDVVSGIGATSAANLPKGASEPPTDSGDTSKRATLLATPVPLSLTTTAHACMSLLLGLSTRLM